MDHNMHQTSLPVCVPSREMKMEKRPCSGIARVTPSSHMGPSTHPTSTAGRNAGLSHLLSFDFIHTLVSLRLKAGAKGLRLTSRTVVCWNVFQESCEWRWTLGCTITPSQRTAARPQATPAPPAPPEHCSAVTPPSTGPGTFTGVCFLTGLLTYHHQWSSRKNPIPLCVITVDTVEMLLIKLYFL